MSGYINAKFWREKGALLWPRDRGWFVVIGGYVNVTKSEIRWIVKKKLNNKVFTVLQVFINYLWFL